MVLILDRLVTNFTSNINLLVKLVTPTLGSMQKTTIEAWRRLRVRLFFSSSFITTKMR